MPVLYDSSRSPIPHDELSKECRAGYLADVKKVLTHYRLYNNKREAKKFYNLCGGEKYFDMEYKYLVNDSEFNVIMDNGKSVLIDRSNRKPWIMDANDLLLRIREALSSLKGLPGNRSEFQISEVKDEMESKWNYYREAVDCAFFALKLPKVLPNTDVGVAPKSSHTSEHIDLTSKEECHETASSVASNEKKLSAKELDEYWIGSFGYERETVDHGNSPIASNDVSSHSNYYHMREEFRACFLKGAVPEALLAKYDVDPTVVEKWLEDLIEERTTKMTLKKLAQSRANKHYRATKERFDGEKDERKQNWAVLQDRHGLFMKQNENSGKVIDCPSKQNHSVDERRKCLDEEANRNSEHSTVFNAKFQSLMNEIDETDKAMAAWRKPQTQYGEDLRDVTQAFKASLEADNVVAVAEQELKVLGQMRRTIGNLSKKAATTDPDAAIAEQKKPVRFGRMRGLAGWETTPMEPVVQNIMESDAAAEFGEESIPPLSIPPRRRAEKERPKSVRRSQRTPIPVDRFEAHSF